MAHSRHAYFNHDGHRVRTSESGDCGEVPSRGVLLLHANDGLDSRSVCVGLCSIPNPLGLGRRSLRAPQNADFGDPLVVRDHHGDDLGSAAALKLSRADSLGVCLDSILDWRGRVGKLPECEQSGGLLDRQKRAHFCSWVWALPFFMNPSPDGVC